MTKLQWKIMIVLCKIAIDCIIVNQLNIDKEDVQLLHEVLKRDKNDNNNNTPRTDNRTEN